MKTFQEEWNFILAHLSEKILTNAIAFQICFQIVCL